MKEPSKFTSYTRSYVLYIWNFPLSVVNFLAYVSLPIAILNLLFVTIAFQAEVIGSFDRRHFRAKPQALSIEPQHHHYQHQHPSNPSANELPLAFRCLVYTSKSLVRRLPARLIPHRFRPTLLDPDPAISTDFSFVLVRVDRGKTTTFGYSTYILMPSTIPRNRRI